MILVSNSGPVQKQLSNKISPKLGALLNVKSARTRAVMKDHMAKNFLALSSKGLSLFFSDPCKRFFSYPLSYLGRAPTCLQICEKAVRTRLCSIFSSREIALACGNGLGKN